MAAPVSSQRMTALAEANRVKEVRKTQRDALRGTSPADIQAAITDPTPEFATYRLREIFATNSPGGGVIPQFGTKGLSRALRRLNGGGESGFRTIHASHRLRELTELERHRLAAYIVTVSPQSWRKGWS